MASQLLRIRSEGYIDSHMFDVSGGRRLDLPDEPSVSTGDGGRVRRQGRPRKAETLVGGVAAPARIHRPAGALHQEHVS